MKTLSREISYFEKEETFEVEINGKIAKAIRYQKQDPKFSDYALVIQIINEEIFTEEEIEEIEEYIEDIS